MDSGGVLATIKVTANELSLRVLLSTEEVLWKNQDRKIESLNKKEIQYLSLIRF